MPDLSTIPQATRNLLLSRPVELNDDAPWTPLRKPLSECTLALVTSAGVHLRDDAPFVRNDSSYRVMLNTVEHRDILQSHSSLGFDRTAIMQDVNVVFPVDRLRELVADGTLGGLGPRFYSFMGAQEDVSAIKNTTSWEVGQRLADDGVDIVLLTPSCPVCTSTISVIARNFELNGLPTVVLSLVREHVVKIRPPRALYVPFPFGLPVGHVDDSTQQRAVLEAALGLFTAESGPVLEDFTPAGGLVEPGSPLQASGVAHRGNELDLATEVSLMRHYWEEWVAAKGRTAVGLSGYDPKRFRAVVRFFEGYVAGSTKAIPDGRDEHVSVFVRHCVDDLKALYFEGRMATHPTESSRDRAHWFWSETTLGAFLPTLAQRMREATDALTRETAHGIVR